MDILINSNERNCVLEFILQHISLFHYFDHVYLFGSMLDKNKSPGDIDLLLIYSEYSTDMLDSIGHICFLLEDTFHLPVDLTVLSFEELIDTDFLRKVISYYKLK